MSKKVSIIISIVALIIIIGLFYQFYSTNEEVYIAPIKKVKKVTKPKPAVKAPIKKVIPKPPENKRHITSYGDNLWDIARTNYNDGELWPLILEANKNKISNPDYLKVKLELIIPAVQTPATLNPVENKQLARAHLTAYFSYRNFRKKRKAVNHLYEAYMHDKEMIKGTSSKIKSRDLKKAKWLAREK